MSKEQFAFATNGFVFQQGFLSLDRVQELIENLQRVIRDVVPGMPSHEVFYEDKSKPETLKQLQRLHERDPYFEKLMIQGPFRDLAETLLQSPVTCQNMQYFNKPPGVGKPTPAHQDGFYFKLNPCRALTMWVALEPVDEQNGCVRYVRGSHLLGMRSHGVTGTLGFSQGIVDFPTEVDSGNEQAVPAEPGDLLAHDALTIHRADGNHSLNRTRRALGLIYYSVDARQDVEAYEKYQSELRDRLQRDGAIQHNARTTQFQDEQ